MELEIQYKGLTIEILKDIDSYNPMEASELYENSDGSIDTELQAKEYQDFLNGNVYGYVILDENKQYIDSIWGYFGKLEELDIIDKAKERIDLYYLKVDEL